MNVLVRNIQRQKVTHFVVESYCFEIVKTKKIINEMKNKTD